MRERPQLTDEILLATLQIHYGLTITTLTFLPIGNDSASFVYRAAANDGAQYFVKARTRAGFSAPSLLAPRFLQEQGIPHIVAPVPTLTQALWAEVSDFVVSVYPFLEARMAIEAGLADELWQELGATLRRIHAVELPAALQHIVPRETFIPSRRQVLTRLEAVLAAPHLADPLQRQLRDFWQARWDEIRKLIDHADTLGNQLRQATLPHVLCHADIHAWNVLLDSRQRLWIVDWDDTVLAPKERDLMFLIEGIGNHSIKPHETTGFLHGYGAAAIDQRALTYYRYAWAVQEMGAYAEDVFFASQISERARSDSLRAFIGLFEPGDIVSIAYASDLGSH